MTTAASDKGFIKPRKVLDIPPMDTVQSSAKNKFSGLTLNYIGGEGSVEGTPSGTGPFRHELYDFVGGTVPDGTDYPDSIAPIGSTYLRLQVSGGAIVGSALYMKTSAATWTLISPATTTGVVTAIKTSAYTVLITDDVVRANTSGGAFTLTLPTASGYDGKKFLIKLTTGGNILTLDGDGSETIDGAATNTEMSQTGDAMILRSDGTNWIIEARYNLNDVVGDVTAIKTTTYTILNTDGVVRANTSGGAFTVTLPTAVGIAGKKFLIKVTTGGNILTVDGDGTETIDGSTTNTELSATNDSMVVVSDGSNWIIESITSAADISAVKTTTYTILATDDVVRCNTSGGAFTVTLPTAVGRAGKEYQVIVTTGGSILTLDADGSETINGAASVTSLRQTNDSITVVSDGANWLVKEQLVDGLYLAEVTVVTGEVLALNATPISVISAPGAGKIVIPVDVQMFLDYATTAYDGVAAGEDLVLRYTDASGGIITTVETTGFLDQAADQHRYVGIAEAAIVPVANAAVVIHLLSGEIATGDSPLKVRVRYKVLDLQV